MAAGFGPVRLVSIDAQSDDETLGQWLAASGYPYVVVYVSGTGTTSSGVVTIEEADWNPDVTPGGVADGWSAITTVNASDVSGGLQKAIHLPVGAYRFVRTRISTAIGGGGTVTTVLAAVSA